jgi:hypothetical protein
MRHATPAALDGIEEMLASLRELGALREKKRGTFYRGGDAFLHFHEDPAGIFADVKLAGRDFTRMRATTRAEQRRLLGVVRLALAAAGSQRRQRRAARSAERGRAGERSPSTSR